MIPVQLERRRDKKLYFGATEINEGDILARSGPCQIEMKSYSPSRLKEAIRKHAKTFFDDVDGKRLEEKTPGGLTVAYENGGGIIIDCLKRYFEVYEFYLVKGCLYLQRETRTLSSDSQLELELPVRLTSPYEQNLLNSYTARKGVSLT